MCSRSISRSNSSNKSAQQLMGAALLLIVQVGYGQDGNRIEELTVTATRQARTIENIAGTVTALTAQIMEQQLANDLDDLVRFQPGVTMNTAARGGNQGFQIRGMGGNRVLTVIDGVRSNDIYAAGPSAYGRDSFELDNLRAVEIIRGPASVLYGADAMGGAVILHSKRARDYLTSDSETYFSVHGIAADADQQFKLGATAAATVGDVGLVFQFTGRQFEEQEVNGPGALNPQDGESDSLYAQAEWEISQHQQLALSLESFVEENTINLLTDLSRSVFDSRGFDATERQRIGLEYNWQGESALADDIQFIVNRQQTDALQNTIQQRTSFSFIDPRNPQTYAGTAAERVTDFEFNQQTSAVNLNARKAFAIGAIEHAFAYGFNFDETETDRPRNRCETTEAGASTCAIAAFPLAEPEVFPNKTFPDTITTRLGFYLQDEIRIGDSGLTIIPGIRYDQYEMNPDLNDAISGVGDIENYGGFSVIPVDVSQTSLSLGAIYDIDETYSFFAQYAEGYRPPNFDEANQAFVNLGFGYATVPNPELQPESSKGLEAGLRASYANAFVSLALYQNRYEDFIESQFAGVQGPISLFQDRNIGRAEIRGAELQANYYLSRSWQLRSSVAYSHGDNQASNTPLNSIDPLTAVVGAAYNAASGRWGADVMVTAVAEKDRVAAPENVTAASYALVDLMANYNISDRAELRLGVFNLFDEQYARWVNIQGLDAAALAQIQNAQQPGTNFRLAFNLEF